MDLAELVSLYRTMARIRAFELQARALYRAREIPGFIHLSLGQEAVAAGATHALGDEDTVTSTHRAHGHALAKGSDPYELFAELMGREDGVGGGLAGSMHIADPDLGFIGANGVVGGSLPQAVGAAFAAERVSKGDGSVTVCFFGDGAVPTGSFHESLNLASLWDLPLTFVCENNEWSEFSPAAEQHPVAVSDRAAAYGIPAYELDGQDVVAVADSIGPVVAQQRAGALGPVLLDVRTERWAGHYEGDPQHYRHDRGVSAQRDPLQLARAQLLSFGAETVLVDQLDEEAQLEMAAAVERARRAPVSTRDPVEVTFAPTDHVAVTEWSAPEQHPTFKGVEAVRSALAYELERDERVFVAGVDVVPGGPFAATRGLAEQFPGRVLSTPISETAAMGLGVGSALRGLRPVIELMFVDLLGVCLDQIINQAAKARFVTGGAVELPLVIRSQYGAGKSSGCHHAQSLETIFAHVPGLKLAMPSNATDLYGLLRAAIQDPNPVLFLEPRQMYFVDAPRPPANHFIPFGRGVVRRPGGDVTVVTWGRITNAVLEAAEALTNEVAAEVIDLRTLIPYDRPLILDSVKRTGRLLVVHEAVEQFGPGSEIVSLVADECFGHLTSAPRRIGAPPSPVPYAPSIEQRWLPGVERILSAMREVVR